MMKIEYQELNVNGYSLRGLLSTPKKNKKSLIVMFHGYTGHKNENGYLLKFLSWEVAKYGYASLRMDFMGSGDSDGAFMNFTFDTEMNDARAIIDYAYQLNNGPIILLGFSMGGLVASRVAIEKANLIEKLILLSPAGNMADNSKITFSKGYDEFGNVDLGGYFINKRFMDSLQKIDPYEKIETYINPVLIIHGENDLAVPYKFGQKYYEIYPNSSFHLIKDSQHCYTKVIQRAQVYKLIIDFLEGDKNYEYCGLY